MRWKIFGLMVIVVLATLGPIFHASLLAAAPAVVTNVLPTPSNGQVVLTWTNPADAGFTGTMVRYSASAFPTSTSDGTLAADVAGSPSATSSTTVTGLTNGTVYYFSLFSHNVVPEYSAAVNSRQLVMPTVFTDDFQADSVAAIGGQNGWTTLGGTWVVSDTAGARILKGSDTAVSFHLNRVLNGGPITNYGNQMLRVDWRSTTAGQAPFLWLRTASNSVDNAGYFFWANFTGANIGYKSVAGTSFVTLNSAVITTITPNTWYTTEFSVTNNSAGLPVLTAYNWLRGTTKPSVPTATVTDAYQRFSNGSFGLGKSNTTAVVDYDTVVYSGLMANSSVTAKPADKSINLSWVNSTAAGYAGTMVRFSTTAYPATPTDGTLVANVTGATNSTSHTGLTNGTTYYYTLFPYDGSTVYGTPFNIRQVAEPLQFSDNFNALTLGSVAGQNGWAVQAGTWTVADIISERTLQGTNVATTYPTNKISNGSVETTDQILYDQFSSTAATNSSGMVWLRRQPNGDGYLVWHNGNIWTISYYNGSLIQLAAASATAAPVMEADSWFNEEISVINNISGLPVINVYIWKVGREKPPTPTVTATDSVDRFPKGNFALGKNSTALAYFDNVTFAGSTPPLTITSPLASVAGAPNVATLSIVDQNGTIYIPYIQTSNTLNVSASALSAPVGGGVEFMINEGLPLQQSIIDLTSPYTASFSGLPKGEYTLDAYVLGSDGVTRNVDDESHAWRTDIGIGDIITVIGDSVVEGYRGTIDSGTVASWLDGDAGTVSLDNRNFPQYGLSTAGYAESFLSDLNDKLSNYYGYPVFLMNEGHGGIRSDTYQTVTMATATWQNRQLALQPNKWLIALGNNDANIGYSAQTFSDNMTSLISTLISTYGATASSIYVPYPLYDFRPCNPGCGTAAQYIATYLPAIDNLRTSLGLAGGADLNSTFEQHQGTDYFDTVHPNATGYVRMARLWALGIMKPTITGISSVDAHQATVNWTSLSAYEPTIAGYRVKYGASPTTLTQTMDFGNVSSGIVTGLTPDATYYFAVQAFDNDPTDRAYSYESNAVSGDTQTATTMTSATTADADGDGQISRIDVSFSNDLTGASVSGADFTVAGFTVTSASETSAGVVTILLTESGSPDTGATPTVSLVGTVTDTFANFIDAGSIVASDSAAPVITSVTPVDGADDVARNATITVAFSEPMDTTNVTYTISPAITGTVSVWSNGDKLLSVTHATAMSSGTDYELTITSADDVTGNLLAGGVSGLTYPATFTTESGPAGSSSPESASISLNSPNGGEVYIAGETVNVRWSTSGGELPAITVTYSIDGGISYRAIATGEADDGVYAWLVPDATSSHVRILVQGTDEFGVIAQDGSVADFTIVGSGVAEIPTTDIPDTIVVQGGGYAASPFTGELELIETVRAGESVRGISYSTVYFIDATGTRHPFLTEREFLTWGISFADTRTVTDATLPFMPLGTPMLPKPSVVLVKIVSDPRVYAIDVNPLDQFKPRLRWIPDEATAIAIYGPTWSQFVIDIDETQLFRFAFGADMNANETVDTFNLIMREDLHAAVLRGGVVGFFQQLVARIK